MNSESPVFMQIMQMIENDIIGGVYKTDDLIISTTEISKLLSVNPTTAVKAISKLTDSGILYKRRGIGMCVANGAREQIVHRRKTEFCENSLTELLNEADTLGITESEIIKMIKERSHD